jgi:LPS-assembly protein
MYAQYRQRFHNGEVNIESSFTNADRRTRVKTYSNKNRGHLFIDGKFDHNDFWRYGFNLKRTTDDTYLSRYLFEGASDRLQSNFFIEGFDDKSYFHATGIATQVQSSTYQSNKTPLILPFINYNYQSEKTKFGFLDINASFLSLTRRQGSDTRKISLQPIITYPFQDNLGNRFKFQAKTTLSSYMVSHVQRTGKNDYKGIQNRIHPEFLFGWDLPLQKKQNNSIFFLKPQAAIILAPNRGSNEEIPNEDSNSFEFSETHLFNSSFYPGNDKLEKSNQRIDYGLNFSVKSQEKNFNSDFFIGQSLRFRKNHNFGSKSGLDDQLSDLIGRIGFGFGKNINLSYRFLMNKDSLFSTRRDQFTVSTKIYNTDVTINYIYLEPTTGILDEREEFNISLNHTFNDSYSLRYSIKEDLTSTGGLLGQKLALTFNNECFTTEIGLNRSYYLDREIKPNDTFLITFIFKTLGSIATGRNISN